MQRLIRPEDFDMLLKMYFESYNKVKLLEEEIGKLNQKYANKREEETDKSCRLIYINKVLKGERDAELDLLLFEILQHTSNIDKEH